MKIVMIAYSQAIDNEVTDILVDNNVAGCTKWKEVTGEGVAGGVHLGTKRWPKLNNVLMMALEDALAVKVMDGVRALRAQLGPEGVKAFMLPCEEVT